MSKLFDQLREAARKREAASSPSPEKTGLLSRALKRAAAERERLRQDDAPARDADASAAQDARHRAESDRLATRAAEARVEAEEVAAMLANKRAEADEQAVAQAKKRAEAEARALQAASAKLEATERALHAAEERARHESQVSALQLAAEEARAAQVQASASMARMKAQPARGRASLARRGAIAAVLGISAVLIAWQLGQRPQSTSVPAPAQPRPAWPGMKLDYQLDLTRTGGAARSSLPDPPPSK